MREIIGWLAVGDRAFNVAMIACLPPLGVVIWIGMMGA